MLTICGASDALKATHLAGRHSCHVRGLCARGVPASASRLPQRILTVEARWLVGPTALAVGSPHVDPPHPALRYHNPPRTPLCAEPTNPVQRVNARSINTSIEASLEPCGS